VPYPRVKGNCLRGFGSVTNIYVGNLSFRATEDEIKQAFSQYGKVARVSIIVDRETGRSRGFGFVEMPDSEEARAAIEGLNQQEIAGRRISCNEAREREQQPRSYSGGGRGGPGGSGGSGGSGGYGGSGGAGRRPYREH
jgi:cold-inducible RNA-binding protein